jgi:hypothetical protein
MSRPNVARRMKSKRLAGGEDWIRTRGCVSPDLGGKTTPELTGLATFAPTSFGFSLRQTESEVETYCQAIVDSILHRGFKASVMHPAHVRLKDSPDERDRERPSRRHQGKRGIPHAEWK